jgi:hypothetical protein
MVKTALFLLCIAFFYSDCKNDPARVKDDKVPKNHGAEMPQVSMPFDTTTSTIHIMVALCDNIYQGIVPVPSKIGNGQNPNANLYWGCGYGIRSYFKKSGEWTFLKSLKVDSVLMERIVFKHVSKNIYLVADAYNGKYIKQCTVDFLNACAGKKKDTIHSGKHVLGINGNAGLVSYIGHDGLMDFELPDTFANADGLKRKCIILACVSKSYFSPFIYKAGAEPLVWTTGLMCPEAYTVHDAISGYVKMESAEQIRSRAALAYSKYQKCGVKAARNLLVTGF